MNTSAISDYLLQQQSVFKSMLGYISDICNPGNLAYELYYERAIIKQTLNNISSIKPIE